MNFQELLQKMGAALAETHRSRATATLEYEQLQREIAFSLMVLAPFAGLPVMPGFHIIPLLPEMEREFWLLWNAAADSEDMLASIAANLDGF